ncbi:RusA family crossover junction endodeoxyribonuclease [Pedobacter helvus]|uniref:RusA family crossover junction endodeoxyribonuclease n=1 Tax=Pedobacter helvus TaxID=2563444 RepID=A0ABW9JJF1_9SPHI|nr:RusA family crossover junction endodeoxyribonuclease [Pedobacter ureilyticus]
MKVKLVQNPDFDYLCGYLGGFDDIPTKQDKFKPLDKHSFFIKDDNGSFVHPEIEMYASNNKAKENLLKFEARLTDAINKATNNNHPYLNPIQLEVIINFKMSEKRLRTVDIDNLVKCTLDIMKGKVFEDDTQVRSLFAFKDVIKDELVPQLSGIMIGVRILDKKPSLLSEVDFYGFTQITDEEYEESKKAEAKD